MLRIMRWGVVLAVPVVAGVIALIESSRPLILSVEHIGSEGTISASRSASGQLSYAVFPLDAASHYHPVVSQDAVQRGDTIRIVDVVDGIVHVQKVS